MNFYNQNKSEIILTYNTSNYVTSSSTSYWRMNSY